MLGIEGYTVASAHFTDNARTVVNVIWKHDTEEDVSEYISATIDKNGRDVKGDPAWDNLLQHVTIDEIHDQTSKYITASRLAYEQDVLAIAKREGLIDAQTQALNGESKFKVLSEIIFTPFDEEKDKEDLFKFKLNLFEVPQIKASKNRAAKAKLRKSTTMLETIKSAISVVEEDTDSAE